MVYRELITQILGIKKANLLLSWLFNIWRSRRDSNSRRAMNPCRFSRPVHSTALPRLRRCSIIEGLNLIASVIFDLSQKNNFYLLFLGSSCSSNKPLVAKLLWVSIIAFSIIEALTPLARSFSMKTSSSARV